MKYDHFSMLPERAFQPRNGRSGMTLEGGGGGGPTQSTVTQSNIPEWLRPQTEALLGAATQEYFQTTPIVDPETGETRYDITGVKPFVPYSERPEDYVAGFTPEQQAVFGEAAGMQRPGQFFDATQLAGIAGMGGVQSAAEAARYGALGSEYGMGAADIGSRADIEAQQRARAAEAQAGFYGGQGFQSGLLGQELGVSGGEFYGGLGAGYGATAADIGRMGLEAQGYGRDVGEEARQYARQAAGMGGTYERMVTDPTTISAYMSPYQQGVIDIAKAQAIEDAQRAQLGANLGAARQGTYGGARQTLAQAQREAALNKQLSDIQTQGLQSAYDRAIQAQQFGVTTGLQGLQGAQAGLGTALQGGQLGLSGIGQALAGQQAGMQGAGVGLQGLQQQLAGTAQGMQGAQLGLSAVDRALASGQLGLSGAGTGISGMQAGIQGAQAGLQGVSGAQAGFGLAGQQATNMANIGSQQQAADIARMQFQQEMGGLPQAQQQRIIDQAIQNYALSQESPFQRLAGYSGLIRGYATPTTTVDQYSAPASPVSQLAGLGAVYYGAGGGKKEGGKIEEGIDTALLKKKRKSKERAAA